MTGYSVFPKIWKRFFPGSYRMLGSVFVFLALFSTAEAESDTDVLRLHFWQAPSVFNPHLSSANKDREASRIAFEPLAVPLPDGRLIPVLAAEIPSRKNGGVSADGRSVTWKLKSGIRWSDGKPFTARDVVFTWRYALQPENSASTASLYAVIEQAEVLNEAAVRLHFSRINPSWNTLFVGRDGLILPEHIYSNISRNFASTRPASVGTGPYVMEHLKIEDTIIVGDDVVRMVRISYSPNPYFREKGKPFFKRIELRGGGNPVQAARLVLAEGAVDFAWNLHMEGRELAEMEKQGVGRILYTESPFVERIMFNFTDPNRETETGERSALQFPHPFFTSKKVRQAFAHAVDRRAVAELYEGIAVPVTNILVSPSIYESPRTISRYPYDLKRAAALLEEAGWKDTDGDGIRDKNGKKMQVVYQTSINPIRQKTQEIIRHSLESLGVDVILKMYDAAVFFSNDPSDDGNFRKFYADIQEYAHNNMIPDPTDYMVSWTSDQVSQQANQWSGHNLSRWCHPEYDRMFRLVKAEFSSEKRRDLFIRMNDLLVEEVVVIPLVRGRGPQGISRSLEGVELTPWDANTWNIKDWKRKEFRSETRRGNGG